MIDLLRRFRPLRRRPLALLGQVAAIQHGLRDQSTFEPRNRERTFLVATHDMDFARSFCTSALWLHQGRAMAFGASGMVVDEYLAAQSRR